MNTQTLLMYKDSKGPQKSVRINTVPLLSWLLNLEGM